MPAIAWRDAPCLLLAVEGPGDSDGAAQMDDHEMVGHGPKHVLERRLALGRGKDETPAEHFARGTDSRARSGYQAMRVLER
jgi:hypothetical protein